MDIESPSPSTLVTEQKLPPGARSAAWLIGIEANALNVPPGEYARKGETQRN